MCSKINNFVSNGIKARAHLLMGDVAGVSIFYRTKIVNRLSNHGENSS